MEKLSLIPVVIATGFGSGYCPVAPGTAGAFLALAIWVGYSVVLSPLCSMGLTVALVLLFTALGIWATNKVIPFWGDDPRRVVVDEMVGVWIPLAAVPIGNLWYALAAFALFRFFDIAKPLGVRRMERLPKGIGVMADDILAGIYSLLIIICAQWLL